MTSPIFHLFVVVLSGLPKGEIVRTLVRTYVIVILVNPLTKRTLLVIG